MIADQYSTARSRECLPRHLHAADRSIARSRSNMPNLVSLGVNMFNSYPHFMDLTVSSKFSVGGGSNAPSVFTRNQYHMSDDIDMIRGRHHIIFGFEMLALQMDEVNISLGQRRMDLQWFAQRRTRWRISAGPAKSADRWQSRPDRTAAKILRSLRAGRYSGRARASTFTSGCAGSRRCRSTTRSRAGQPFLIARVSGGPAFAVSIPMLLRDCCFTGDPGIPDRLCQRQLSGFAPRVGSPGIHPGKGSRAFALLTASSSMRPRSYTDRDFGCIAPWGNSVSLTAPAGGFANPYAGLSGRQPIPHAVSAAQDAPFRLAGLYINLPAESASHVHAAVGLQLSAADWRELDGVGDLSRQQIDPPAFVDRSQSGGLHTRNSTVANTQHAPHADLLNPAAGAYYSTITLCDDGLNTNYNALRLNLEHRFAQQLHAADRSTRGRTACRMRRPTGEPQQSRAPSTIRILTIATRDYGPCDFDLRHNLINVVGL